MLALPILPAHAEEQTTKDPPEELVIVAARAEQARADVTAAAEVIDRARIEASGARTVDELLRSVPGVEITPSRGGASLSLQGLGARRVLVLIDGRPADGRVDGTLDLTRLRVADLERVEIVKGPSSALYGADALGGVVNLVTRSARQPWFAEANARHGTWRSTDASAALAARGGAWSGRARATLQSTDGYDLDPTDEATTADELDGFSAGARLGWSLEGAANAGLGLDYQRRDIRGVDASPTGAVFDRRVVEETATGALDTRAWTGATHATRLDLAGSLWRQQYLTDQRGSDVQDAWSDTRDARVRLAAGHERALGTSYRHFLVAGLDAEVGWMSSERLLDEKASRQRVALYAQDDWKVLDDPRIAVAPGVRLDLDSQFGAHPTPRLAVRVDPIPALAVRASVGTGFRAPDFKELRLAFDHAGYGYVVEGNEELRPELSRGVTLDVDGRVGRAVALGLGGWWNDVDDLIDVTLLVEGGASTVARYTYANVAQARTRGLEASVSIEAGALRVDVGYTLTDARDRADEALLDGRAPHRGTVALSVPVPVVPIAVSVQGEVVGPRPWTDDTGGRAWSPTYAMLDARLAGELGGGIVLEGGVRNALDAREDVHLGLAPRSVWIGLSARTERPPTARTPARPVDTPPAPL